MSIYIKYILIQIYLKIRKDSLPKMIVFYIERMNRDGLWLWTKFIDVTDWGKVGEDRALYCVSSTDQWRHRSNCPGQAGRMYVYRQGKPNGQASTLDCIK